MISLRSIGAVLPQSLLLLIIGSQLDLHSRWNQASPEFVGAVIVLFVIGPVFATFLLIVEIVKYRKRKHSGYGSQTLIFIGLAIFFLIEALIINGFIFSQFGMWADEVGLGM